MKQLSILFFLLLSGTYSLKAQDSYTLTVNFINIQSNKGAIYVALHNNEAGFLKVRYKQAIVSINNNKATATFTDLPENSYAVAAFHDVNENGKMDTNFIGIPKEPIGISNNAKGFMGPPKFNNAKFLLNKNTVIGIEF